MRKGSVVPPDVVLHRREEPRAVQVKRICGNSSLRQARDVFAEGGAIRSNMDDVPRASCCLVKEGM